MLPDVFEVLVRTVREVATEQVECELRELRENLASVQERCTALLGEKRLLRTALDALEVSEGKEVVAAALDYATARWSKP